jgi:hypothetical protein
MKQISRDEVKKIFKKRKKLRIPPEFDDIDFGSLYYYSWYDAVDRCIYMLFDYDDKVDGIVWETEFFSQGDIRKGRCEICQKTVELRDMVLVTSKTKFRRKGVTYVVRGNYICSDHKSCNEKMDDTEGLDKLVKLIYID